MYVVRHGPDGPTFLLLRRASGRLYAGSWRMVGGKIAPGEQAWQAAVRELWEETGLHPSSLWAMPSVNAFYEWQTDTVNLVPAFLAQVEGEPALNPEHDRFEWLPAEAAAGRLSWPEQQRLLLLAGRLFPDGFPEETRIPVS